MLALSICKAINFYIAPEAPGCEVGCGSATDIFANFAPLRDARNTSCLDPRCAPPRPDCARERRSIRARRCSDGWRAVQRCCYRTPYCWRGRMACRVACVGGLAPHAATDLARRLPKFVTKSAGIQDASEVSEALVDDAHGKGLNIRVENWLDVLAEVRRNGCGGYFLPGDKSSSADSYFLDLNCAIGIFKTRIIGALGRKHEQTLAPRRASRSLRDCGPRVGPRAASS